MILFWLCILSLCLSFYDINAILMSDTAIAFSIDCDIKIVMVVTKEVAM